MVVSDQHVADIRSIIDGVQSSLADKPPEVQSAATAAATTAAVQAIVPQAPEVPPPTGKVVATLWIILVSSLSAVVLGSAGTIAYYLVSNKHSPPDVIITIFTTSLSGVIGLFVRSPSQR